MKPLDQISKNFFGPIIDLSGRDEICNRLRELGFVIGENLKLIQTSPFGGPIIVEIKGALFALRKEEAKCIQV